MKKILTTLLFITLFSICHADWIKVWKQDGSLLKSFPNPTQDDLDRMEASDFGYIIFPDKAASDAVTQQQIDDAIAQAIADQNDSEKSAGKWIRAIIKTIAFYEGVPPSQVRAKVEGFLP